MAAFRASAPSPSLSPLLDGFPPLHVSRTSVSSKSSVGSLPLGLSAVECAFTKHWISSASGTTISGKLFKAGSDAKAGLISEFHNILPASDVLKLWQTADAVCFDIDSTVCIDEGIDELANFCGTGEAVAAWTSRAMGGSVRLEEALAARLDLIHASISDLKTFLASKPPKLSPRIQDLVQRLHSRGVDVYLVSGGFRQMIEPVAALLHIAKENIYANQLLFDKNGNYAGFDKKEPTSCSGGKAVATSQIKKKHGYEKLVMIGDGATDLEAKKPGAADMFICFGGVHIRPAVAAGADWFILSFEDLIEALGEHGGNLN